MGKDLSIEHKKLWVSKMSLDLDAIVEKGKMTWSISGMMILKKDGMLEVGIRAISDKAAFFEIRSLFQPSAFDPNSQDEVSYVRLWVFAFLFPYLRTLVDQTFSIAHHPIESFPFIAVNEVFGKVELMKE